MPEKTPVEAALDYLNRQGYTEKKLTDKLKSAGFSETAIGEALERLKNWGYLNDPEFAANRIRQLQARLKSRSFVILDLEGQGISKEIITRAIYSYYPEEQELVIAAKLLTQKMNSSAKQSKLWGYLLRAGFSEVTIRHCFPNIDPT